MEQRKSVDIVQLMLDDRDRREERGLEPPRKRQRQDNVPARAATESVDWTRLHHETILHILEYEEMVADLDALELIGRFKNDTQGIWYLMFRSM